MRNYMRNRYHNKRQGLISQLGGKCKRCGSDKDLHVDHIDRKKKDFRAADIHSVSDEKIKRSLPNLQLLCAKCHAEKTNKAWDRATPKPSHGSYWMRRRHGCRCDKCEEAYKNKLKEWKEKKKEQQRKEKELQGKEQRMG